MDGVGNLGHSEWHEKKRESWTAPAGGELEFHYMYLIELVGSRYEFYTYRIPAKDMEIAGKIQVPLR